jgi:Asp-tRNA(Asn)/Glu-tRNA(Gln) amidotransferase A subunit family amidase
MADPTPPSRRSFLLGCGSAPALAAGAAVTPMVPRDDADDFAAAARLAGLEFTADERTQAVARLRRQRETYAALRRTATPFELPPCAAFDPWPAHRERPAPTGPIAWQPRPDVAAPATDVDLAFVGVDALAALLRQRRVTSRQLTELALARLQRFDADLHCVVALLRDEALATADRCDAELAAGKARGPLHGIPYGAKDLFAWPSAPTTFGAAAFRDHVWPTTAAALQRLHDAGAVLVAKLSLGALAMGDLWHGGRTRNPWRPDQGSSGSSAGSASAVAAGLVPFALGTETLGSIVSPCVRCGVAGLRPTFGAVSRHGAMPLSWTLDKVGPIARSAVDAALVFDALRGADPRDPSSRAGTFAWQRDRGLRGLRFGVLQQDGWPRRDDERAFVAWLREQGADPVPVALPDAPWQALLLMLDAEAAAAFDEFTRSGRLGELPGQGDGDWPNQFRAARAIPAVEYLRASRLRQQLCADYAAAAADIDVLVAPTHGPILLATNLTGHPTYVLPVGADADAGAGDRPTLLALVGRLFGEGELLAVGEAWQRATSWHLARPELAR